VDELIGVEKSEGKDKRVGILKRKFREMIVLDDFITNKNILLKDSSVRFQEKNFMIEKGEKESAKEGSVMV
jgi:hypothetical protein